MFLVCHVKLAYESLVLAVLCRSSEVQPVSEPRQIRKLRIEERESLENSNTLNSEVTYPGKSRSTWQIDDEREIARANNNSRIMRDFVPGISRQQRVYCTCLCAQYTCDVRSRVRPFP